MNTSFSGLVYNFCSQYDVFNTDGGIIICYFKALQLYVTELVKFVFGRKVEGDKISFGSTFSFNMKKLLSGLLHMFCDAFSQFLTHAHIVTNYEHCDIYNVKCCAELNPVKYHPKRSSPKSSSLLSVSSFVSETSNSHFHHNSLFSFSDITLSNNSTS